MTDTQLGIIYAFNILLFVLLFALLSSMLDKPTTAMQYADKLCQQLYGPQVGAIWTDKLMCQTVRGEILPIKQP